MFSSASSFFSCCLASYLKDLRLINRLFVFFCLVRGNWVIVLSNAELLVLTAGCQWASEVWQYRVARAISHKKVWPRWVHSCETFFFFFALRYRRKTKNTKNHAKRTNGIQTTKLGIWKYEHFPISQCHPQDGNHDRTIPLRWKVFLFNWMHPVVGNCNFGFSGHVWQLLAIAICRHP